MSLMLVSVTCRTVLEFFLALAGNQTYRHTCLQEMKVV